MVWYTFNGWDLEAFLNNRRRLQKAVPHTTVLPKDSFLSLLISAYALPKKNAILKIAPLGETRHLDPEIACGL